METSKRTPRHEELLALFEVHFETERRNDVEACMKTLHPEIVYEHPFRPGEDFLLEGTDAVRAYYIRHWGAQPFESIVVQRSWLCGDDTLLCEVETTVGGAGGSRKATSFALGVFRDGLLIREITMTGPFAPVAGA